MDVILTIGFKITAEMEIRKHTVYVLRPTSQMRRIGYIVFILSIAQLMWLDHIKGPFIYYIQARVDWGFGAGGTIF